MSPSMKPEALRALFPWYLNGTLSERERALVEAYLREHPQEARDLESLRQMRAALLARPMASPSPQVPQELLQRVRSPDAPAVAARGLDWRLWALGAFLSLVALALLWSLVRPGVVLRWTVVDGSLQAFRVYRAASSADEFFLLGEVPAQEAAAQYTFTDTRLVPGQQFTYLVEGLDRAGQPALKSTVPGDSRALLTLYLALIFSSLVLGYSATVILRLAPWRGAPGPGQDRLLAGG